MSRPETLNDIEINNEVQFANVQVNLIATDAALLKAYAVFMEAVQKAGGTVEATSYAGTNFHRPPSLKEQMEQLEQAQTRWDEGKKQYEILRDVGQCEYDYQKRQAEKWAEEEKLPFPPESEPIKPLDVVIRDIDQAAADYEAEAMSE